MTSPTEPTRPTTHVVIIAGGAGTRFWPSGRRAKPKQLLPITSDRTMLAETLDRCEPLAGPERTWIITSEIQLEATRRECPRIPAAQVVAEPMIRNTAAAGTLITVGIKPTGPATGYGYIEGGEQVDQADGIEIRAVKSFKEKPDVATAAEFIASGRYFWNSGTFVWLVQTLLDAFERHLPAHAALLREISEQDELDADAYARFENVPIDIGIMERAENVEVIPGAFEWDDVGSWLALDRLHERDEQENVVRCRSVCIDTTNCTLVGSEGHLLATLGVKDLIIVQTPDATLVCRKDRAEDVRRIVEMLRESGLEEFT